VRADIDRAVKKGRDSFADLDGSRRVFDSWANHQELVAAHPANVVANTHCEPKAIGDCGQKPVAGSVTYQIIDRLEAIQIDATTAVPNEEEPFFRDGCTEPLEVAAVWQDVSRSTDARISTRGAAPGRSRRSTDRWPRSPHRRCRSSAVEDNAAEDSARGLIDIVDERSASTPTARPRHSTDPHGALRQAGH
jgi:hypothetical protein